MRILAIETSGRYGSIALCEATSDAFIAVVESKLTAAQGRTAQTLAPALAEALSGIGWPTRTIGLVTVAIGPGSFTGLRIGVTTAKTFAYAAGAEIVGVNTLAVLAEQAPASAAPLWTILDAQRQELFAARFVPANLEDAPMTMLGDTAIVAQDEWLARLKAGERVIGPPLKKLTSRLPAHVIITPPSSCEPTATAVGRLGWRAYQNGRRDDLWKLVPLYYRPSAAEEKAAQRRTI